MRTTVDCFCGAGGLSCGLAAAGLHVSLGIDCDERALSVSGLYRPTAGEC